MNNGVTLMIDSGVGGLSVLSFAHRKLPQENFLFFADAAFSPYGDKTVTEIRERLHNIIKTKRVESIKAILLACNTATSAAAAVLREELEIPVIGMEPALKPAVINSTGQIVVMATALTIREEKFRNLLSKYGLGRDIVPLPCPGLMEIVEKNPQGNDAMTYLENILEPYRNTVSAIVLGCTHYVFLRPLFRSIMPQVQLFDGNEGVVKHLETVLMERDALGGDGDIRVDCSLIDADNRDEYLKKCKKMLAFCDEYIK